MKIYYPISVDLYNQYPLQVITAQQANIGRGVMLTLTANNAVLVPENESLFVYVKKPDGTKVYADCVLSGNQVQIDFTQQMLAVPGMLEAELQMIDASGNNITTPIFLIDNQASNIDYAALESSDEFKALVDALAEVEYYREHGLVGPPGEAATITVGEVEASVPGSAPQVTNSGTSQNAVLNFTLPRGEPGSVWYFGTAITGTETSGTVFPDSGISEAKIYDKYINTDTGNIYDCSMAGSASTAQWTYIGSIMGPAGATQIVFAAYSDFPETGDTGKIYVDTSTTDELVIWRWTGAEYVTTEHGALEMIADGLDPDESYVVNDYLVHGNKFRKVTTAFGPGEYDDSKTEVTTVAAELKSQNSKMEMNSLPGTGCTLYYNDYEVFIEINTNAASTVDGILDTLQLPEKVKTKEQNTNAVWFTLPILGQNWNPLKENAYISFAASEDGKANVRFSNNSLSNINLIGSFSFPRSFFIIS